MPRRRTDSDVTVFPDGFPIHQAPVVITFRLLIYFSDLPSSLFMALRYLVFISSMQFNSLQAYSDARCLGNLVCLFVSGVQKFCFSLSLPVCSYQWSLCPSTLLVRPDFLSWLQSDRYHPQSFPPSSLN